VDVARPVFAPDIFAAVFASIGYAIVALDHRWFLSSHHAYRRRWESCIMVGWSLVMAMS
jgi:hypothetical protein